MNSLNVRRETYLKAESGDSIYAGAAYSRRDNFELLENIRHEALFFAAGGQRHYYSRRLRQRRSPDNGQTWAVIADSVFDQADMRKAGDHRFPAGNFLLPGPDIFVELGLVYSYRPEEPQFGLGNTIGRTYRTLYRFTGDGGTTWSDWRQAIDHRPAYDANNWAPGVAFGIQGGVGDGQAVLVDDSSVLMGFTIHESTIPQGDKTLRSREIYSTVRYARARWRSQSRELEWTFGDPVLVPYPDAAGGACEPALARLVDGRWFNTMRCQGDEASRIYSRRMTTISTDGGMTWSKPVPLAYEDGSTVWTPASFHRFFVHSRTGKTFLLANILPGPVFAQTPRYPLCIAEFDAARGVVLKRTVSVIQDRPPGAPADRRYTNFGCREDRRTGELVLTLPEHPLHKNYDAMTEPGDYTGDCIIFRIGF